MVKHDVADLKLADEGKRQIEWAWEHMGVLSLIKERFEKEQPLKGLRVAACLHVTKETANLMIVLKAGGAKVSLCASNPLSTQDAVAAGLVKHYGISTYAIHGEDTNSYYKHLNIVLDEKPHITMDDGCDLVSLMHKERKDLLSELYGSSEETTTGVIRLKAMEKAKALSLPVIAVNDSATKHMFDNRYGTGQSTIDGVIRATNLLLAGKRFVVSGYGWCGKGIAKRAAGMGSKVIVTEVDPIRALEAAMDGFEVMKMKDAAKVGDIFVSATGDKHVIAWEHIELMRDGAVIANSGHFDVEIDMAGLQKKATSSREIRESLMEYTLPSKRRVFVIGEGRLVNLAAAEGHPAEVMDMSFANQALAAEYLVKNRGKLKHKVYTLPEKLDKNVAALKLKSMGVKLDSLTQEQKMYLDSWEEGT